MTQSRLVTFVLLKVTSSKRARLEPMRHAADDLVLDPPKETVRPGDLGAVEVAWTRILPVFLLTVISATVPACELAKPPSAIAASGDEVPALRGRVRHLRLPVGELATREDVRQRFQ